MDLVLALLVVVVCTAGALKALPRNRGGYSVRRRPYVSRGLRR